jgi:hypothetical protein
MNKRVILAIVVVLVIAGTLISRWNNITKYHDSSFGTCFPAAVAEWTSRGASAADANKHAWDVCYRP